MTSSIAATTSSVLTGSTPLPSPTSTLPQGGSGSAGGRDSGVIAGAVIAVLILLVTAVALTVVILLVKQRSKSKSLNGSLWYIKTSPGAQRKKVPSYILSEGTQFVQEVSSKSMTPEFLVVRHKKPKSTVPNASIFCYSERPTSIQSAQRWSERSSVCPVTTMTTHRDTTPTLSTGDVTLPRHIRSSSVDTNSTQPFGGSSTAASSLSRPGKNLKVYQMPSVEDDNIILTNESEKSLKTLSL